MKIFISHATSDKPIVDALRALLTSAFVETVEVAYSSASVSGGGIAAGHDWLEWIRAQVQDTTMTIVIVTPLSKTRPWLMWEAGAVSGVGLSRRQSMPVVPLLFGLKGEEVPGPLGARQIKIGTLQADILDLLDSMRGTGNVTLRAVDAVEKAVDTYLTAIRAARIPGMHDVFISCPMTSAPDGDYGSTREIVEALTAAIAKQGYTAYSAICRVSDRPDPEAIAAERDLSALIASRNFLMIYPSKLLSSCLLEAGYALVSGVPSTYFVRSDDDLPYMLRGAVESFRNARRVRYRDPREIIDFFERYPNLVIT